MRYERTKALRFGGSAVQKTGRKNFRRMKGAGGKITKENFAQRLRASAAAIPAVLKKDVILSVSLILAAGSAIAVRPDSQYAEYIDFRTLALLLALMTAMAGIQRTGFFRAMGERLIRGVRSTGQTAAALVFLCFFSSMIITNDVALVTFVPFAVAVCRMADMERLLVPIITMQTIAANLGSMVTPVGNPQNLYIYSKSGMSAPEFFRLTAPFAGIAFIMLLCFVLLFCRDSRDRNRGNGRRRERLPIPAAGLRQQEEAVEPERIDRKKLALYLALFAVCLLSVFRVLDVRIMLAAVLIAVLLAEPSVLKQVDYGLLLTFTGFFIFVGNIARIPFFHDLFRSAVQTSEMLSGVIASQVISNVPAVLLLSGFTDRWDQLLIGVNIGGLGTLVASMASLISFKYLVKACPGKKSAYFKFFTAANLVFLGALALPATLWM